MLINQVLSKARFRSSNFGLVSYEEGFSGALPATGLPTIYAIRQGQCFLQIERAPPVLMRTGDCALVTRGPAYKVYSDAAATPLDAMEMLRRRPAFSYKLEAGVSVSTQFFACQAVWDDVARETIARMLPDLIVVENAEFQAPEEVDAILAMASREIDRARTATPVIVNRLANMLLCEMLLAKFGEEKAREDLLRSTDNPAVTRALMLIHSSIIPDFTVKDLADRVSLSRSGLTLAFIATLGVSPGRYLIDVKLSRAAALLTDTSYDVASIADMVGYDSTPSFVKAFRQRYGAAPNRWRHRTAEPEKEMSS